MAWLTQTWILLPMFVTPRCIQLKRLKKVHLPGLRAGWLGNYLPRYLSCQAKLVQVWSLLFRSFFPCFAWRSSVNLNRWLDIGGIGHGQMDDAVLQSHDSDVEITIVDLPQQLGNVAVTRYSTNILSRPVLTSQHARKTCQALPTGTVCVDEPVPWLLLASNSQAY